MFHLFVELGNEKVYCYILANSKEQRHENKN
jgi:hypothetical protein